MLSPLYARLRTAATGNGWERPTPTRNELRADVLGWLATLAVGLLAAAGYHSAGLFQNSQDDVASSYGINALMTLPLLARRRYPLAMLAVGTLLFYLLGIWNQLASATIVFQLVYFCIVYTAVAWAKNRQLLWTIFTLVCLSALVWIVGVWAVQDSAYSLLGIDNYSGGLFSMETAGLIITLINNAIFFGFAGALGHIAWVRAYQHTVVQQQAELLRVQSEQMARDAVTRERLRISRELHDSVGHHVSAMGIQAAAARKALAKKPELAAQPLAVIEELARSSVGEMKQLIGVLRAEDTDGSNPSAREPQLSDIPELVERTRQAGLAVDYRADTADVAVLEGLSQGTQLSLYRIVQEALNNSLKHAQARSALVVARTGDSRAGSWVEVEVTDDGRAGGAQGGSGFGLRGIRERAETLGGTAEMGPRTGAEGWRVRVRIPVARGSHLEWNRQP